MGPQPKAPDANDWSGVQFQADISPGVAYACTIDGKLVGHYAPVRAGGGVGRHVHSGQIQVAYVGLDGIDKGKLLFAPLVDWDRHFRRVDPPSEEVVSAVVVPEGKSR